MVAINVPRSRVDWALGSGRGRVAREDIEPDAPRQGDDGWAGEPEARPRARPLPDRATRVRRRRILALVALVAIVLLASALAVQVVGWIADVEGSPSPEPLDPTSWGLVAGQEYVVQPGDTMWSIAAEIAPDRDPRAVVDALREANGGPELEVGDRLILAID
jgi:LysM domain